MPGGYSIRYLIFVLADGHIERARDIAERCTLADAVKWNHFRAYESKVQEDMIKRAQRGR